MSNQVEGAADDGPQSDEGVDHLDDLECGAGCTEIWEHLSDHRRDDAEAASDD